MVNSADPLTDSVLAPAGSSSVVDTSIWFNTSVPNKGRFGVLLLAATTIDSSVLVFWWYCSSTLLTPRSVSVLKGAGSRCTRLMLVAIWNAAEMLGYVSSNVIVAGHSSGAPTLISTFAVIGGVCDSSAGEYPPKVALTGSLPFGASVLIYGSFNTIHGTSRNVHVSVFANLISAVSTPSGSVNTTVTVQATPMLSNTAVGPDRLIFVTSGGSPSCVYSSTVNVSAGA